ncbi:PilZ domain-containing protein [Sphingomonas sp. LaA6.9]|uniref:PilZ domain-containing protein n=1 Tax=Sphingomonas sp. LaA6.9 TaxID=2919914 RepID=UPI001F4F61C9|nr:PilZ domain-containing protein [Sphingomonas sp. LaA6.9]MCJ8155861.1 PilZ domain-containing protein [Sphingomonas sp. LaA6.9]
MTSTTETTSRYQIVAQEDRCAPRASVSIPATLRPSGSSGFSVVVTDLSVAGFACQAVTGIKPGMLCWLTLPGLSGLQAEVVWNNGSMVGCAFARLLNQAVLDLVVSRYRTSQPELR